LQKNKNVEYHDHDTMSIYEIWLIIRKRKWVIFTITLLFFGFSIPYAFLSPDVYKVSNVVQKPYKIVVNMADIKANMLLLKGLTGEQRAKALDLEEAVIADIRDIKISKIEGTDSFQLQVDTTNPSSGVKMLNALVIYADKLPFVQKIVERRKEVLKEDSGVLKKIIDDPLSLLNLPDKTIITELLPSLYGLKTKYNATILSIRELEEGGFIDLAGKTFVPKAPYKPRRIMLTASGLFAGIFIGIFFAFFMEWLSSARHEYKFRERECG